MVPSGRGCVFEVEHLLALLFEEQAPELVDHDGQQLALVVVARAESQTRARADLVLDLAHGAHVVVLAERPVLQVRVVGPAQELGVGPLDVIALVEGVEGTLPVGREDDAAIGTKAHLFEPVGGEQGRERAEERLERLCVRVHVDEDEAAPAPDLDLVQADLGIGHRRREVEAVDHLFVGAVELEAPGVEAAADLPGGEVADPGGQAGAFVRTGVVEGRDGVGTAPGDQDRLVANDVLEVVAHRAHFFFAARHLPDPGPQPFHLEVEELLGDVALLGNDVGLRGGNQVPLAAERHHHRASPSPSAHAAALL